MKINYLVYIFSVIFRKSCRASELFHLPKKIQKLICKIYYSIVRYMLKPYFYKVTKNLQHLSYKGVHNKRNIWMFWWQGEKEMPLISKKCVQSVMKHSSGHKVIFIDKYNVKKFTDIPKYIYDKLNQGIIDFTHFSDIVRFNLLKNHGGIWIDSTMFCSRDLDKSYFVDNLYTSGKFYGTYPYFVNGRWVEGLIGGNKNNSVFRFMNAFNMLYWKNNNLLANYFMEDYVLRYIYNHNIGGYYNYITNMNRYGNNPCLYKLINSLNKPYNDYVYKKMRNSTSLFDLTYKTDLVDNGRTLYSKIINNKL